MSEEKIITIKGIPISGGKAEGEALVSREPIGPTGTIDNYSGVVIEKGHELYGKNVAGRILVFPTGKASTTGPWRFLIQYNHGKAPKAMLCDRADGIVVVSALITGIPAIHRFDKNPIEVISTGDWVKLDADRGIVEVKKRARRLVR